MKTFFSSIFKSSGEKELINYLMARSDSIDQEFIACKLGEKISSILKAEWIINYQNVIRIRYNKELCAFDVYLEVLDNMIQIKYNLINYAQLFNEENMKIEVIKCITDILIELGLIPKPILELKKEIGIIKEYNFLYPERETEKG